MSNLIRYGWSAARALTFEPLGALDLVPARVVAEHRGAFVLQSDGGELRGELSGRLRKAARVRADLPAVGDWAGIRLAPGKGLAAIDALLPRHGVVSRKVPGEQAVEQLVAVNVDRLLVVMGLDGNYNLRRLERALTLAQESGARPVVVLTKADLADDLPRRVAETQEAAGDAAVVPVSVRRDSGLEHLAVHLVPRETVALLGSSGVGKSTLLNRLCGEERQATGPVRAADSKGRHTTSARQLVVLPNGALLIDTPGLREMQLWADEASVDRAFADVLERAAACRFRDCRHEQEPGCAVLAAVQGGTLDPEREASHRKILRELRHLETQQDERARLEESRRVKAIHRSARKHRPRE